MVKNDKLKLTIYYIVKSNVFKVDYLLNSQKRVYLNWLNS